LPYHPVLERRFVPGVSVVRGYQYLSLVGLHHIRYSALSRIRVFKSQPCNFTKRLDDLLSTYLPTYLPIFLSPYSSICLSICSFCVEKKKIIVAISPYIHTTASGPDKFPSIHLGATASRPFCWTPFGQSILVHTYATILGPFASELGV
jgi:hypothetical protein